MKILVNILKIEPRHEISWSHIPHCWKSHIVAIKHFSLSHRSPWSFSYQGWNSQNACQKRKQDRPSKQEKPDHTASLEAVLSGFALFVKAF